MMKITGLSHLFKWENCTIGGWLNTLLPHCICIYIYQKYTHKKYYPLLRNLHFCHMCIFKGIVYPKKFILSLYSPSCRSKPVRPWFIFGTQIKIFMKSKSFLTLHRQQCNWNVHRPRNIVSTSLKSSMWHQLLNRYFTKLREYFCVQRKQK